MAARKTSTTARKRPKARTKRASASRTLAPYAAKRDFTRTAEPTPTHAAKGGNSFVVQHHWATRDHYDFRLELDGVLKSWAVTRGPSANPRTRRLAVRVEDHPVAYSGFEGLIPKGEYGGGTVMLWDRGTWESLDGNPQAALKKGELKFRLDGARMKGEWVLVRIDTKGGRENWLLIKHRDALAEDDDALTTRFETSVSTGRGRDEIEKGHSAVWSSRSGHEVHAAAKGTKAKRAAGAKPPAFVPPMLCAVRETPPEGDNWICEIKYDGYRLEAAIAGGTATLYTRSGQDWTARFPAIAAACAALPCKSALLDGEAVVLDSKGLTDFPALVASLEAGTDQSVLIAFDALMIDGKDLRRKPLLDRKAALKTLLRGQNGALRFGDHVTGDGATVFARAVEGGAEGIISKRADAPYVSGRGGSWIKIKGDTRADVIVVGWQPSQRGRAFASLVTATERDGVLHYTGGVGTGFSVAEQKRIIDVLLPLERKSPPDGLQDAALAPRNVHWVAPTREIEVRIGGWTTEGQLRQARYIAMRREPRGRTKTSPRSSLAQRGRASPASKAEVPARSALPPGTRLTHPDRLVYPRDGITKADVAAYYDRVRERMLPYLDKRPVSILRAPDGIAAETFFQRHPMPGMKDGIVPVKVGTKTYFAVAGATGLMTAAQFGTVEFHGWGAHLPALEKPDRIVFDLDPAEDVPFTTVREAAVLVRDILEAASLPSFPLLSGGKGVHVVVPLKPKAGWDDIAAFAGGVARAMEKAEPDRFVAVMTKAKRKGRIFIDWLRNTAKATAIVPYSLRARPGAPAAWPITWQELKETASANAFTLRSPLPKKDAWTDFFNAAKPFPLSALKAL